MFYQEISLLRIHLVFLIIRELSKDLCIKIMCRVFITKVENCDQNKNFGKIMDMKTMLLSDYHVEMLIERVK